MTYSEWQCSECGNDKIEEVVHDAKIITVVSKVIKDADSQVVYLEYANECIEDGGRCSYQCSECGDFIPLEFLETLSEYDGHLTGRTPSSIGGI